MWSGAIVDIPDGWLLCDGNNGTPDLRNRFLIGAGDIYAPDATGGALEHNHPIEFTSEDSGLAHKHWSDGDVGPPGAGPFDYASIFGAKSFYRTHIHSYLDLTSAPDVAHNHDVDGVTDNEDHVPPYYALAYIMKT